MKNRIIEYHIYRWNKCKVKEFNLRKGKYKPNPNFAFHYSLANQLGKYDRGTFPIVFKKEYTIESK